MKSLIHSKKFIYILLTLIIFAGIVRFSYGFFVEKQGTHSDEEWSFGLANSYYEPYIYSSDDVNYLKNNNQWLSGNVLKDYLTVQKSERFSFDSVFYNMSCDTHPPLYFIILHFLSSFFTNQYLPVLALLINLFCYIIIIIYLYRLLHLMSKSHFLGIICAFFYTFTVGSLSMAIYMRMYQMLAMFALMLIYYNAVLYYSTTKNIQLIYLKLSIISCLGALTHHFFLPFAFIITAVMCLYYIFIKKWSISLKYAICMLLGICISIAIFPATLDHMLGIKTFDYKDESKYTITANGNNNIDILDDSTTLSTTPSSPENFFTTETIDNYEYKIFKYYFFTCLSLIFKDILGFSPVSPYKDISYAYLISGTIIVLILLTAFSFLCRKEPWFLSFKKKAVKKIKLFPQKFISIPFYINYFIVAAVVSILFIVGICSYQVNVLMMGLYTTRYLFIIYPITIVLIIYFIYLILHKIISNYKFFKIIMILITIFLLLFNNIYTESPYLWKSSENNASTILPAMANDSDFIIITSKQWYLTIFSPLLYDCDNFYYTSYMDFIDSKQSQTIDSLNSDNKLYLILETTNLYTSEDEMEEFYSSSQHTLYRLAPEKLTAETMVDDKKLLLKSTYYEKAKQLLLSHKFKYKGTVTDFGAIFEIYELN